MTVAAVVIIFFLAMYTIMATSRSTHDRLTRKMGIAALGLVILLFVLQILIAIEESHTNRDMQDKLKTIIYKTIDEQKIQQAASKILGPSGEMFSWWFAFGEKKAGEKVKVIWRTLAIPKPTDRIVDFVIIDSDMPGAPDFHPMIPGKRISYNEDYYVALVLLPEEQYQKNPYLVVVTKYRNGEFDIKKYRFQDIAYDPKEFLPPNPKQ